MYLAQAGSGSAVEDRRFALKRATRQAHAKVERIVQDAGMFASHGGFRRYLAATHAMRAYYERLLDLNGAAELWPRWPTRRIAALVSQDIADLGVADPGGAEESPDENLRLDLTKAELMGILYVLEGSSLGARVLVNSVADIGLTASFGARHLFRQAGDRDAWRSFLALMSAATEAPCHHAAEATFEAFAQAYRAAAAG